ncbi:MAG: porin family protein [Gammaproteobacteria bacterium]|nr:porin family protein [Gammaproteobacteria bacterium]
MKNTHRSLPIAILIGCLILMLTSGISAKEAGFYLQGGITYWNNLDDPKLEFETDDEDLPIEYEIDGSRGQISIGGGFHVNEEWSLEAFYVRSPELIFSIDVDVPLDDIGDSISLSWNTTVQHAVFGVSAVYDFQVNQYLSWFGKVGLTFTQSSADTSVQLGGQRPPSGVSPPGAEVQEEESQDIFAAIGVRVPLKLVLGSTKNSITFAFQFFETPEDRETSFEIGLQWNF